MYLIIITTQQLITPSSIIINYSIYNSTITPSSPSSVHSTYHPPSRTFRPHPIHHSTSTSHPTPSLIPILRSSRPCRLPRRPSTRIPTSPRGRYSRPHLHHPTILLLPPISYRTLTRMLNRLERGMLWRNTRSAMVAKVRSHITIRDVSAGRCGSSSQYNRSGR